MPTPPTPRPWRPAPLVATGLALHAGALATVLAAPRLWPWALGVAVADHAVMATAGMLPRCSWLGPTLVRLPASEDSATVALTFDDGPDPEVTPRVLDLLAQRGLQATFFVIGELAQRHPEILRRMVAEGHRVENHTWCHPNTFGFYGLHRLGREIDRTQEVVAKITGRTPIYFRAPAGIRSPLLDLALTRRGLILAAWTRRGFDTMDSDPDRVYRRLVQDLHPGNILLLHDGRCATTAEGSPVVLEILPRLLDALETAGLRGAPLPDETPFPE
ncbi:MAG: polysaccharide deacetylase family protein [Acidobacteriota bacterium]|nr:polysaccharide deacetylase family protein [Acidobacteriota bacterium]